MASYNTNTQIQIQIQNLVFRVDEAVVDGLVAVGELEDGVDVGSRVERLGRSHLMKIVVNMMMMVMVLNMKMMFFKYCSGHDDHAMEKVNLSHALELETSHLHADGRGDVHVHLWKCHYS